MSDALHHRRQPFPLALHSHNCTTSIFLRKSRAVPAPHCITQLSCGNVKPKTIFKIKPTPKRLYIFFRCAFFYVAKTHLSVPFNSTMLCSLLVLRAASSNRGESWSSIAGNALMSIKYHRQPHIKRPELSLWYLLLSASEVVNNHILRT